MDPREHRDSSRHSLHRAPTAVTIVTLTILLLALAAVGQSLPTTRFQSTAMSQRHPDKSAEQRAKSDIWRRLLA